MKILITCPPMIKNLDEKLLDHQLIIPENLTQTLSMPELKNYITNCDIWIVGDDQATEEILRLGVKHKLKMVIKWGVGTDNIDIQACKDLGLYFTNTPGMFGEEVSDVIIGYMIMLARDLHNINKHVIANNWYKPTGMTLVEKKVALLGYGNIGQTLVRKLVPFNMDIKIYDPLYKNKICDNIKFCSNEKEIFCDADFIIISCPLTKETHHLINKKTIHLAKKGVYIINVSRGSIINEKELIECLEEGYAKGAALDVFETEPLPGDSSLKKYNCIFGSHNGSNTKEAVERTNKKVIEIISKRLPDS